MKVMDMVIEERVQFLRDCNLTGFELLAASGRDQESAPAGSQLNDTRLMINPLRSRPLAALHTAAKL